MKKLISLLIVSLFVFYVYADVNITCSKKWKQHQHCDKKYYELCYIEDLEVSEYVYYKLLKENAIDDSTPRKDSFRVDQEIITGSASSSDYTNTGFDRGHLANVDDFRYDTEAMKSTYLMTNIAPQTPAFNRGGAWRESEVTGEIYAVCYEYVEIITGPIFINKSMVFIGNKNKVAVSDGFFKIFYNKDAGLLEGYIIYQGDCSGKLSNYSVPIEVIEDYTGLRFEFK